MEHKIGEIFEYNGEWYQCLEDSSCRCNYCDFDESGDCDNIACVSGQRSDNKEVYFKKLEKVGEPYEYFVQHKGIVMLQPYKLLTTPFINGIVCNVNYDTNTIDIEIKQNKEDIEEYRMRDAKEDIPEFDKVVDECLFGEDKLNLKSFDIEAAKTGKQICTRDGRKARMLCFDRVCCDEISTIVACVLSKDGKDENVIIYSSDGFMIDKQHPCADDLMMLPKKRLGWAKVRKDINLYDTKEEADRKMIENDEYVTAKVCWEE